MIEVAAIVLVLALVFAAKSISILREQDDAISKSVSFSWVKPLDPEEAPSAQWAPNTEAVSRSGRVAALRRQMKVA